MCQDFPREYTKDSQYAAQPHIAVSMASSLPQTDCRQVVNGLI